MIAPPSFVPATGLRLACVLALAVGCASTGTPGHAPPDWVGNELAGLDAQRVLVGVASQRGSGPEAAAAARSRAVGRLIEQIVADVSSEAVFTDNERATLTSDDGDLTELIIDEDRRQRLVRITSNVELVGVRYEVETVTLDGGPITHARASVDRNELADVYTSRARSGLVLARSGLAQGRRLLDADAGDPAAAIHSALRGWQALEEPASVLPVVVGLRPASGAGRALLADYGQLRGRLTEVVDELRRRLSLTVDGAPAFVSLSGHVPPLPVRALWDGAPLAGLSVGVQADGQALSSLLTGADGRATIRVDSPALRASRPKLAVVVDERASPLTSAAALRFPTPSTSRVAVVAAHRRSDERPASTPRPVEPSPLAGPLAQLLGQLNFRVVTQQLPAPLPSADLAALGHATDYVLRADSLTLFSSRTEVPAHDRNGTLDLVWYRTGVDLTLFEVATGESLSFRVDPNDSKAAGQTAEQGARRSLDVVLRLLADRDDPQALPGVLLAHFGGGGVSHKLP